MITEQNPGAPAGPLLPTTAGLRPTDGAWPRPMSFLALAVSTSASLAPVQVTRLGWPHLCWARLLGEEEDWPMGPDHRRRNVCWCQPSSDTGVAVPVLGVTATHRWTPGTISNHPQERGGAKTDTPVHMRLRRGHPLLLPLKPIGVWRGDSTFSGSKWGLGTLSHISVRPSGTLSL